MWYKKNIYNKENSIINFFNMIIKPIKTIFDDEIYDNIYKEDLNTEYYKNI